MFNPATFNGVQQAPIPVLALYNGKTQVTAVTDFRIGCIARLCLIVAPLYFDKRGVVKEFLRSDENVAKVPSRPRDSSTVQKLPESRQVRMRQVICQRCCQRHCAAFDKNAKIGDAAHFVGIV